MKYQWILLSFLLGFSASAAEIHTVDGSVLQGTILELSDQTITIQTALFGELTIDRDQINSLIRDEVIDVPETPERAEEQILDEPAEADSESLAPILPDEKPEAVAAMVVDEEAEPSEEVLAEEAKEAEEIARKVNAEKRAEPPSKKIDPWETFAPPLDSKFDWLQLTSGEWLKGDFKVMYDFTLEFDSDEMDLQEFDFDDVAQLRTRAMKSVFIEGEGGRRDTSILRGMLVIRGDQVKLRRSEHEVSIPRERVISIASGQRNERDHWSGKVSIGFNERSGNTKTIDTTVMANAKRRTARSRLNIDYLANYSKTDQADTANNQRLSGYFDWFITSRFFWKALDLEYYRDPFSNIGGQYSVSTGFGYDLIHTSRTEWTVNMGVGYQELLFDSVLVGDPASSKSPIFTSGTQMDYELTDSIDLVYDYSMRVLNQDNGQYTHHMIGTISFDLIGDLDLDISAIWDRIQKPQLDSNGTRPKQDDHQLIIGLGYDF